MKEVEDRKKKDKVFLLVVSGALFLTLIYFLFGAAQKELWFDEVAIIGFISEGRTIRGILHYYLTIEASNLPLYAILLLPFYNLFPAKELWLLLPGICMVLFAIGILVKIANQRIGRTAAYVVLTTGIISTTVINRMGLELRAYSLMFLLSVLVLDRFLCAEEKPNFKNLISLWICGSLLMYSHYFGCLCMACLGFFSLLALIRKKGSLRVVIALIGSAIAFIPWFVLTMSETSVSIDSFWIEPPKMLQMPETIGYLLGGNYFYSILFGVGFLWILYDAVKKKRFFSQQMLLTAMTGLIIGGVFIYSRYISPGGGLYENRYFLVLLPYVLLILGYGIERVRQKRFFRIIMGIILLLGAVTGAHRCYQDTMQQYDIYSASAQYILEQNENLQQDSLIIMASYGGVDEVANWGWYHYYLERRGITHVAGVMTDCSGSIDQTVEACADSIQRIYVFGDVDHASYSGTDYTIVDNEDLIKLTVYERK